MPGDVVDIWNISPGRPGLPTARFAGLLTEGESARSLRLSDAGTRNQFIVARGALRLILSHYLGLPPRALRLTPGRWGKPELDGLPLRFSLSHTRESIMIAVTGARGVGVDLEGHRRGLPVEAITRRFFPADEAAVVCSSPAAQRQAAYLRLWVRKEACVKAVGGRLAQGLPLRVSASPDDGQPLIVAWPGQPAGPLAVRDIEAPRRHAAAVALTGSVPFTVATRRCAAAELSQITGHG